MIAMYEADDAVRFQRSAMMRAMSALNLSALGTRPVGLAAVFQSQAPAYCPMHHHATIELVHHLSGHGTTRLANGQSFRYAPHDVVIYPAAMPHDQSADRVGTDLCIHLRWPTRTPPIREGIYLPPIADPRLRAELVALLDYRPTIGRVEQAMFDHRASALLLQLLSQRQPTTSAPTDHASLAAEMLRTRFDSIRRLDEIADALGVSPDHLRHLFTRRFGMSMQQVLIRHRIDHARNLLAHSPMGLKAIAQACGFANERYFCSTFKRLTGMTPGTYRARETAGRPRAKTVFLNG